MPLLPEAEARYPGGSLRSPEWLTIRGAILDRAGHRCECRGECGRHDDLCGAPDRTPHPVTGSRVVLTIAHLDHDPDNSDPDNLRAMCQRCHLACDAALHARNAYRTRRRGRAIRDLFDDPPGGE